MAGCCMVDWVNGRVVEWVVLQLQLGWWLPSNQINLTHISIQLPTKSSIHPSIHPFIYPYMHSSIQPLTAYSFVANCEKNCKPNKPIMFKSRTRSWFYNKYNNNSSNNWKKNRILHMKYSEFRAWLGKEGLEVQKEYMRFFLSKEVGLC